MKHECIVEYSTIAIEPSLQAGERGRTATRVKAGRGTVAQNLALATAVAVVTLGSVIAIRAPKVLFLVLNDRRLLLLEPNEVSGRPTTMLAAQYPRHSVTAAAVTSGRAAFVRPVSPVSKLLLSIAGADGSLDGLQLTFFGNCRADTDPCRPP